MVRCAVLNCRSRSANDKDVGFFQIPGVITNQCRRTYELSKERQQMWLLRMRRENLCISRNTKVCGKHFVLGRPAKLTDPTHPDWAPSLDLGHPVFSSTPDIAKSRAATALSRYERRRKRLESSLPELPRKKIKMDRSFSDTVNDSVSGDSGFIRSADIDVSNISSEGVDQGAVMTESVKDTPQIENVVPCDASGGGTLEGGVLADRPGDTADVTGGHSPVAHTDANQCVSQESGSQFEIQTDIFGSDIDKMIGELDQLKAQNESLRNLNEVLSSACDDLKKSVDDLKKTNEALDADNKALRSEVLVMREKVKTLSLDEAGFADDDSKVHFYTGIPTHSLLKHIYNFVECKVSYNQRRKLTKLTEFFLVLMRLRLGLLEEDLAYRFDISQSTVSTICDKWIPVMSVRLSKYLVWPDRDILQTTMPNCFKEAFGNKVAVIIDCFEIFIDRATSLVTRAETWSQYKHHNTVKYLIGITPQGTVCFISNGWGGRASDSCITLNSGFLDKLTPGDVVLADRGFTVEDEVGLYQAKLEIPAFTKGLPQMSVESLDGSRCIANVRIHVERMIGFIRRKFRILSSCLPVSFVTCYTEDEGPQIDDIVKVCCALANLCPPIVSLGTDDDESA